MFLIPLFKKEVCRESKTLIWDQPVLGYMPTCQDCVSYSPTSKERGECRINGETTPDRDSDRCPSRTFIPRPGT